jgi:calcineurin-like phosphoesterase family protein
MKQHWFTADLHLGHGFIIRHCHRPFTCAETMDLHLIDQINDCVDAKDVLYILGDFCWGATNVGHYREQINCREVHLIQGNHDPNSAGKHFSTCHQFNEIKVRGQRITLCHYPLAVWPGHLKGAWHLYGHCHSLQEETLDKMYPGRRSKDAGVDNAMKRLGRMGPFSFDILGEMFA